MRIARLDLAAFAVEMRCFAYCWEFVVVFRIVAVKEDETVKWERSSELIAPAKARVWASEGWDVKITDDEGKQLENLPAENAA
jgi:hypothetical protein